MLDGCPKEARFYFIFQNSEEESSIKRYKTKTDHCRLSTNNYSLFSPSKKIKFEIKFQHEEHDQVSNECIQNHTSTEKSVTGASKFHNSDSYEM